MRTQADRMRVVAGFLAAATAGVLLMLVYSMILGHADAGMEVYLQVNGQYAVWDAPWGVIKDRKGELLVGNLPRYEVDAEIQWITDTERVAREMLPYLPGYRDEPDGLATLIDTLTVKTDNITDSMAFSVRLDYNLTPDEYEALSHAAYVEQFGLVDENEPEPDKKWLWPNLRFYQTWIRDYPEGDMLAHTLGYVDVDGEGSGGVEAYEQLILRPEQTTGVGFVTLWNYPYPKVLLKDQPTSSPGNDVYLTVDRTIQSYVEDELDRMLERFDADGGTVIVMKVRTGDILAVASRPRYEPADYSEIKKSGQEALFYDPAVSLVYEPGSVFKAVTIAAALDSGSITPAWNFYDTGVYEIDGLPITNAAGGVYYEQDVQGVLDHSINTGIAKIVNEQIDEDTFYDYITRFGFGYPTNVELARESSGMVTVPAANEGIYATNHKRALTGFGQAIEVTPLQMINAINVIANGGYLMEPHIVSRIVRPDDSASYNRSQKMSDERVISQETALLMQDMLEHVVVHSVTQAQVPGYRVAGKTGTAQVLNEKRDAYETDRVITSFVGFGPLPDPELIILVKFDGPKISPGPWGVNTAAPAFSILAQRIYTLMGYAPTEIEGTTSAVTDGL